MLFSKDFLRERCGEDYVSQEIVQKRRWETDLREVFEHEGKFYETFYSVGNTEYQDTCPYYGGPDQIECLEVKPVQKSVTVYERV